MPSSISPSRPVLILSIIASCALTVAVVVCALGKQPYDFIQRSASASEFINNENTLVTTELNLGIVHYCQQRTGDPAIMQSESWCGQIESDCRIWLPADDSTAQPATYKTQMPHCAQFNAIRALLLVSIILAGFTLLFMFMNACCLTRAPALPAGLGVISSLCGFISMILLIDYIDHQFYDGAQYDIAFWIVSVGLWPIIFVSSLVYLYVDKALPSHIARLRQRGRHGMGLLDGDLNINDSDPVTRHQSDVDLYIRAPEG